MIGKAIHICQWCHEHLQDQKFYTCNCKITKTRTLVCIKDHNHYPTEDCYYYCFQKCDCYEYKLCCNNNYCYKRYKQNKILNNRTFNEDICVFCLKKTIDGLKKDSKYFCTGICMDLYNTDSLKETMKNRFKLLSNLKKIDDKIEITKKELKENIFL